MNKEELIELKRLLEEKATYTSLLIENNKYVEGRVNNYIEIKNNMNTKEGIKTITDAFESAIYYCCREGYKFDKIIILPTMCPFVKTTDLKKEGNFLNETITLKPNPTILDEFLEIDISKIIVMNNGKKLEIDESKIQKCIQGNWCITTLTELKQGLLNEGLELKGISKISKLLNNNHPASIEINFKKNKTKSLKNK